MGMITFLIAVINGIILNIGSLIGLYATASDTFIHMNIVEQLEFIMTFLSNISY